MRPRHLVGLVLAACLTGCGADQCVRSTTLGAADTHVTVTRNGDPIGLTATVTGWDVTRHPQTNEKSVHIDYRFDIVEEFVTQTQVAIYACAVDTDRVVLACATVGDVTRESVAADTFLNTESANDTAMVLLLPDDVSDPMHPCTDLKDFDGYLPPDPPERGTTMARSHAAIAADTRPNCSSASERAVHRAEERGSASSRPSSSASAAAGSPERVTATARLTRTTGDAVMVSKRRYQRTIRVQFVASAVRAIACSAAMWASTTYRPS